MSFTFSEEVIALRVAGSGQRLVELPPGVDAIDFRSPPAIRPVALRCEYCRRCRPKTQDSGALHLRCELLRSAHHHPQGRVAQRLVQGLVGLQTGHDFGRLNLLSEELRNQPFGFGS